MVEESRDVGRQLAIAWRWLWCLLMGRYLRCIHARPAAFQSRWFGLPNLGSPGLPRRDVFASAGFLQVGHLGGPQFSNTYIKFDAGYASIVHISSSLLSSRPHTLCKSHGCCLVQVLCDLPGLLLFHVQVWLQFSSSFLLFVSAADFC